MKILSLFTALLISTDLCHGFADWETTSVPISSGVISLNPDFQSSHHSHAIGNGKIYVAFVVRNGTRDTLSLITKDLYRAPTGLVPITQAVEIDNGQRITSVQIRRCPVLGVTHLVYSKFDNLPNSDISAHLLTHATYQPGTTNPVSRQTLGTSLQGSFETSLKIHYPSNSRLPVVGLAFYTALSATTGSLSYAALQETGDWNIATVLPDGTAGQGCDLDFDDSGNIGIAYEGPLAGHISYAVRSANSAGLWSSALAINPTGDVSVSQPSLIRLGNTRYLVYVERNGLTHRLRFQSRFNAIGSLALVATVDTIVNPPGTIFPAIFSNPKLVVSEGRVVVTYGKSRTFTSREPWLAVRSSGSTTFTPQLAPVRSGDNGAHNGQTVVSLDGHAYPVISWISGDDRGIRACFCPDWTDRDKDGVPYLQEKAFKMNPNVSDIHLYPEAKVLPNSSPGSRDLALVFALPDTATVDAATQVINSGPFRYQPQHSQALRLWSNDARHFESSVLNLSNPFPSSATIRTSAPIGDFEFRNQFLRVDVFRR